MTLVASRPLQLLHVPKWKLEEVNVNIIMSLPEATIGQDTICVVIDKLTLIEFAQAS